MSEQNLHQQFLDLITGYWKSQSVSVAAKLGIADLLRDGPRSIDDLAAVTQTNADALFRLLRALASLGVFREIADRQFELTPLAERMCSDAPGSQRAFAIMNGEEHFMAWSELLYSVQTGKIAFDKLYGMPIFEFLSQDAEKGANFDAAMVGVHGQETAAMLDAYDFGEIRTLADVGGGNGTLLSAVLQRHPHLQGMLYDLPGVIERAKTNIAANGLSERVRFETGSFFEQVPPGADAYMMRHIIHDWTDVQCTTILSNCRQALGGQGRVLVIDAVIPPGNEPNLGKLLDLNMLVLPGGKERTEPEFRELFAGAGFELRRVIPTASMVSILEAVPV